MTAPPGHGPDEPAVGGTSNADTPDPVDQLLSVERVRQIAREELARSLDARLANQRAMYGVEWP